MDDDLLAISGWTYRGGSPHVPGRVHVGLEHVTETWDEDGAWCWACLCGAGGEEASRGAANRAAARHRIGAA
jgi:hypothetical protein